MTKIEEMLAELCPNGVEWKELGEVTLSIKTGLNPRKFFSLNTPDASNFYITVREIRGHKIVPSEKTDLINDEALQLCSNRSDLEVGDVLFTGTGTIGNVATIERPPVNWNIKEGVYAIKPIKEVLNSRYLMHYFETEEVRNWIAVTKAGGTVQSISMRNLKTLKIPIPPLEIQEEIVKILDKFTEYVTELTAELTAELTFRQKQYSYFRDKLLSFDDESMGGANNKVYQVEWKMLGEVADFYYGYTDKAQDSGDARFIRITDINESGYLKKTDKKYVSLTTESQKYLVSYGDLLMARTGATYGKTLFIDSKESSVFASFLIKISPKNMLHSRYYWHFSKSDLYWSQVDKLVSKAGQPQFNANSLKKLKIPLPSLEIQSRIVQVLDNFDTVCNDLNIGLPKEIELRQKQYDYFRDKLLTFAAEGVYTNSTVQYRQDLIRLLQWVFGPIQVSLGAIAMVQRGASPRPIANYLTDDENGVAWIKIGDTSPNSKYIKQTEQKITYDGAKRSRLLKKGDFILSNSMSYGRPYILEIDGAIHDGWASISDFSDVIQSDFLYYYLSSNKVQSYWSGKINSGSVSNLNSDIIKSLTLTLPSLDTQSRIVSILDKFDELTNSLSTGLPKEIEQRQKQYEYFREKLLSF